MKFSTKAVHAGVKPDPSTGAIMTPIFQTSTYVQNAPGDNKGFAYSRTKNPTRSALEDCIAVLENGAYGLVFGSGLAAIDAVIKLLKPGDEVVTGNDLYGGAYRLFTKVFESFGIKFHFVDMCDLSQLSQAINERTKMIWIETPTNPMMSIVDLKSVAAIAQEQQVLLAVDNTFASPALQNPMDLGADIVMHSVTKYLGGHSDVVMGALVMNDQALYDRLSFIQNACGAIAGPQDCFLVLRGIKTLGLRMQRHCENGEQIAHFLKAHHSVDRVYWPGFQDHPNYEMAKAQMKGFGGMISFSIKGDEMTTAIQVMQRLQIFALAESLGGVESLVNHPATMTHGAVPKADRLKIGLTDGLIRLSVGIEDADDLMADLAQALEA